MREIVGGQKGELSHFEKGGIEGGFYKRRIEVDSGTMKKVYIELAGKFHSSYSSLISYPPEGYEFIMPQMSWDKGMNILMNQTFIYFVLQRKILTKMIPVHLVKSYMEKFSKRPPQDVDLTYSFGHLVFRREPWILDLEWSNQLTGFNVRFLKMFHRVVEKTLASNYCKKILCYSEVAKRSLLANLDSSSFENKIEVVPRAVVRKDFIKTYNTNKVKLLFVGTANIPGEFYLKGGHIVLEAFSILKNKYPNSEMVVRSDIPKEFKGKYTGVSNLRIIDKVIPWQEMEHEFETADIFLFPAHHTPATTFLDAMSYELPIITTDVHANAEFVEDKKTGLLIKGSDRVPYYIKNWVAPGVGDNSNFNKAIKLLDEKMVAELVEKTSFLIENQEIRRSMGESGREEVEHGRFSIRNRNEKLKKIFDEATQGNPEE